ncbi:uncharacterized protein LOC132753676 [Ruditapes philippinarum]|uniref:uncharacterized protein LOC132753676 n=1 Tax=Ruditapes philippinarum TaxID=129788 RepID=UPI00295AA9E8|nr:uncharacterized protein LOC132753676 [Ruditapes philippinarum]
MYLEDNYDCVQHTNSLREFPKEPVSKRQNTKVSEKGFSPQESNFKRDDRQADDIQCHPAKQQTPNSQIMKSTQHDNLDKNITDICPKSQATCTRQISEKLMKEDIRNVGRQEENKERIFHQRISRCSCLFWN